MSEKKKGVVSVGGEQYKFVLTVAAHERVKRLTGTILGDLLIDLDGDDGDDAPKKAAKKFGAFIGDVMAVASTAYAILLPKLEAKGISQDAFLELLTGKEIVALQTAIQEALLDFLESRPTHRQVLSAILKIAEAQAESQKTVMRSMESAAIRKVKQIGERAESEAGQKEIDALIEKAIREQRPSLFGNSQELSVLTQAG